MPMITLSKEEIAQAVFEYLERKGMSPKSDQDGRVRTVIEASGSLDRLTYSVEIE